MKSIPRTVPVQDAGAPRNEVRLHLETGAVRHFEADPPLELSCDEGRLWVTQTGDPRDYILRPGESLKFSDHGRVVVEAVCFAKFSASATTVQSGRVIQTRRSPSRVCAGGVI